RINSEARFHVLNNCASIENRCDSSYNNWWKDDILSHLDDINCKTLLANESENFKFKAQANGLGKGKSLPTVAKASSHIPESAEVSSSNESDHALLSSCISKGIFKKQDIGSNCGSIPSTIVPVDSLGSTKQTIQERCQTRATEAEHNLACARSEDGANHTTTKSPTSRVNPSCDALNDLSSFLELSPRSRNKAFPPLSDLATLNSIPGICGDQNLDNDIIGALFDDNDRSISIIFNSGEILSLVDGENVNPCEGE
ncbi:unnamed protein product, partial [Ilex paraguariensis]